MSATDVLSAYLLPSGEQSLPRHVRYSSFISETVLRTPCLIVGCGAVGGWLATFLTHLGISNLTLVDPDTVSPENLGCQPYSPSHLGQNKAEVLQARCRAISPALTCSYYPTSLDRKNAERILSEASVPNSPLAVFSAADSMLARKTLFEATPFTAPTPFFCDSRIAALSGRVFTITKPSEADYYATTLFPDSERSQLPCTASSSPHIAIACATVMLHNFCRRFAGLPTHPHLIADFTTQFPSFRPHNLKDPV